MEEKKNALGDAGIYLLMENISEDSCGDAITYILEKNLDMGAGRLKEIKLIICSMGGHVPPCFALIDIIMASKIPVTTIGIGQICSCGLLLFMSGKYRVLTPNTSVLSHQYAWGSWGKEHELVASRKEQDLTANRILEHYKKCTGLSEKVIRENLLGSSDSWITAVEARKFHLCDEVREFSWR